MVWSAPLLIINFRLVFANLFWPKGEFLNKFHFYVTAFHYLFYGRVISFYIHSNPHSFSLATQAWTRIEMGQNRSGLLFILFFASPLWNHLNTQPEYKWIEWINVYDRICKSSCETVFQYWKTLEQIWDFGNNNIT